MGNLVEIKRDYLFNALSVADIGVFTESEKSKKVLFIRKFGITLIADGDHGYVKSEATAGTAKVAIYELNSNAPSDPTKYEEIVTIDPIRKSPGWDELPRLGAKTYGGSYNVSVSGSAITAASKQAIIENIVNQMDSDPEAIVTGGYAVKVTDFATADTVTLNGGSAIGGTGETIDNVITEINAGTVATAHKISTTSFAVVFSVKFVSFATDATKEEGFLGVKADSIDTSFAPKFLNSVDQAEDVIPGRFPFMTSDDVRRTFVNNGNHGDLGMFADADKAIAGAEYVKYTVYGYTDGYNNQTPGGDIKHKAQFQLYILKSLIDDVIWDASDYNAQTGITADVDFDDLMTYWNA